jgi:hypothetical protein
LYTKKICKSFSNELKSLKYKNSQDRDIVVKIRICQIPPSFVGTNGGVHFVGINNTDALMKKCGEEEKAWLVEEWEKEREI